MSTYLDALDAPDGWGFCSRRSCPCWHDDGPACEEFCDSGHRHGRCARCGMLAAAHPSTVLVADPDHTT